MLSRYMLQLGRWLVAIFLMIPEEGEAFSLGSAVLGIILGFLFLAVTSSSVITILKNK